MRSIMFALAVSTFAPLLASPANAQTFAPVPSVAPAGGWPICLTASEEGGARCDFATVRQCRVLARGGLPGTCMVNPVYGGNNAYASAYAYAYDYAPARPWY